jgi:CheY-like chemotaxis protein/ketosteroid isomerase-like protein
MFPHSARNLLLIEDDQDTANLLTMLLSEEGFPVTPVTNWEEARSYIAAHTYALIVSDLYGGVENPDIATMQQIIQSAAPTPIGIMTARPLQRFKPLTDVIFVLQKPVDVEVFLTEIAAAIHQETVAEKDPATASLLRFFSSLNAQDWDGLMNLCTDDVVYIPSRLFGNNPPIQGKAAYRQYAEKRIRDFPQVMVDEVHVYPMPLGRTVRYTSRFQGEAGDSQTVSAAAMFHFRDNLISQIGIGWPGEENREAIKHEV